MNVDEMDSTSIENCERESLASDVHVSVIFIIVDIDFFSLSLNSVEYDW